MLILISNDDGIHAAGINALAEEMTRLGRVIVVAPDREQSATSHALTMYRPLRVNKVSKDRYAVDGTPSDCVTLAIGRLLGKRRPDLILSGINHGPNLGDDVMYSGTVAAAFEGHVNNIPSIAVSQLEWRKADLNRAAQFVRRFIEGVPELLRTPGLLLNINVPHTGRGGPKGLRITRLGHRVYTDVISEKLDPRGRSYYWIAGTPTWEDEKETDYAAIQEGYASVTPLKMEYTNYDLLERMRTWRVRRRVTPAGPQTRKRRRT